MFNIIRKVASRLAPPLFGSYIDKYLTPKLWEKIEAELAKEGIVLVQLEERKRA